MGKITLKEVIGSADVKEFLMLPVRLYRDDKNWIRPLDNDIERLFDPKTNKLFRTGEAIRWIAINEEGKTVGRVAAFYDKKSSSANKQPTGGMGFFESENCRDTAFRLFDACREWLKERGMEAMDGPVNFGDRDRWWGLLVDGFFPPNYAMPYNFPYYRELFEEYGFKNYFNQYTYYRPVSPEGVDPSIMAKAERIRANPDYSFRYPSKRDMEKVPIDFMTIYNKAWARYQGGGRGITETHARALFKTMKPIVDRRLLWFGYYKDEPISFFIMLPEINSIVKHLNGKMDLIGKLKFMWHRHIAGTTKKAFGLIFGVVPEHQKKGVEGAIIGAFADIALAPGFPYRELEFNWIGDFNPSMIHLIEQIGATVLKTHITYRYMFNPDAPFERAAKVNV